MDGDSIGTRLFHAAADLSISAARLVSIFAWRHRTLGVTAGDTG